MHGKILLDPIQSPSKNFLDNGIIIPSNASGEVRAKCPKCGGHHKKKNLAVNVERGAWHCWRCGWKGGLHQSPSTTASHDAETIQRQIDEQQRQRSLAQRQAAANARKRWDRLQLTGHHPYLDRKGIGVHGIRFGSDQHGSFVAVPMRDASGQMVGLQRIYDQPLPSIDTNKVFGKGTAKAGSFHVLDTLAGAQAVYIAEGYATAASIFEATQTPTVVTFDAGNLEPVALAIRAQHPDAILILAADHDQIGIAKATAAAIAVHGLIVYPAAAGEDFNDLHRAQGSVAVRDRLATASAPEEAAEIDQSTETAAEIEIELPDPARLERDCAILASAPEARQTDLARRIVQRHIAATPVRRDLDDLLAPIRTAYRAADWNQVDGLARWIMRKRTFDATRGTTLTDGGARRHPVTALSEAPALIQQRQGVWIIKAPMGQGKTQHVLKPLTEALAGAGLVAVCHRQSLSRDLARVLGIPCYLSTRRTDSIADLAICANSLINPAFAPLLGAAQVVLIDEIAQVLRAIGTAGAMKRPGQVYERLKALIRNAKIVVGCDADLSDEVVSFLREARPDPINLIELTGQPTQGIEHGDANTVYARIQAALAAGERIAVASDSRKEVQRVEVMVRQQHPDLRVLAIHADVHDEPTVQEAIAHLNAAVEDLDVMIYSPSIASGVSIETARFQRHFGLYTGTVTPSDFLQMLHRDRTAQTFEIGFVGTGQARLETDPAQLAAGCLTLIQHADLIIKDDGLQVAWTDYDQTRVRVLADDNRARNDAHANLLLLAEARGYALARMTADDDQGARQTASESQSVQYADRLQAASDIDADTAQAIREGSVSRTQDASDQLHRHELRQTLGIPAPAPITDEDIALFDQGSIDPKVRRFELLSMPKSVLAARAEAEVGIDASRRRCDAARQELLHLLFDNAGLDVATGQGTVTEREALESWAAWNAQREEVCASRLGHVPRAAPKYPIKWLGQQLARLGLRLEVTGRSGGRGHEMREYGINPDDWATMTTITQRRRHMRDDSFIKSPCGDSSCGDGEQPPIRAQASQRRSGHDPRPHHRQAA